MDRCKSRWEGDYGDIPCRLYEGHGGPHESEWAKFADGQQLQERWMPVDKPEIKDKANG